MFWTIVLAIIFIIVAFYTASIILTVVMYMLIGAISLIGHGVGWIVKKIKGAAQ